MDQTFHLPWLGPHALHSVRDGNAGRVVVHPPDNPSNPPSTFPQMMVTLAIVLNVLVFAGLCFRANVTSQEVRPAVYPSREGPFFHGMAPIVGEGDYVEGGARDTKVPDWIPSNEWVRRMSR